MHVQCEKNVNVKIFNNGKIQMTGLKYETHGEKVLELLLPYLQQLDNLRMIPVLLTRKDCKCNPLI